jgi:peptidyl-prolyl cis-trans isomerase A (cyclophilin A)
VAAWAQESAPAKLPDGLYVTLTTSMGVIKGRLYEKESPKTVENFVNLATGRVAYVNPLNGLPSKRPFYDGLIFHRVIREFMIQGGDPFGNGTGGTENIPDEVDNGLRFDSAGKFGMANAGPNTGSCQFFITEVATPHLNGLHTVFGEVVAGQDVVFKIARVQTNNDRPTEDVKILSVVIDRVGPTPAAP